MMLAHYFAIRCCRSVARFLVLIAAVATLPGLLSGALADHIPEDTPNGDLIHLCDSCHDPSGSAINTYFPTLAGQHYEYLVRQIELFRTGGENGTSRRHPTMELHAKHLSEDEVEAIARHYANRSCTTVEPSDATGVRARCAKCHGPHGISSDPNTPNLIGQNIGYMENQLRAFLRGERNPAGANSRIHRFDDTMTNVVRDLTDEDIRALVYYATLSCR